MRLLRVIRIALLECGDSSPLSLVFPAGTHLNESSFFCFPQRKRPPKESGDESPHSKRKL
jgi:hypothetical protein